MFRRWSALAAASMAIAGCDFPTETPRWEQTWVVPAEPLRLGVATFLPDDVAVNSSGTAFVAPVDGQAESVTLAEMCPPCVPLHGQTQPKPAFTHTFTMTTSLPAELVAAVLAGGELRMRGTHSFPFDPLRPAGEGGERGHVVVEVTSDGNVVARDSLSGHDHTFTAATPLEPVLDVRPVEVVSALDITFTIVSPEGDPVAIDVTDTLAVELLPTEVLIASATVEAGSIDVDLAAATFDFGDVDQAMIDRVREGRIRLDVENPFQLEGDLTLEFELPGGDRLVRSVEVEPGEYTRTLSFTGDELRELLGAGQVTVRARGTVAAPDGTLTVTPTQELVMETRLELVILVGGSEAGT